MLNTAKQEPSAFGFRFTAETELYGLVPPFCAWRQHPNQFTDPETFVMEMERSVGSLRKEMDYKGLKPKTD